MKRIGLRQMHILAAVLMFGVFSVAASPKERMRIIVSAAALDDQDPFLAFYHSRIFRSEEEAPFIISNADAYAFETDDAIFYAASGATPESTEKNSTVESKALIGHSYRGLLLSGDGSERIRRYLGADSVSVKIAQRRIDNTNLIAISKTGSKDIAWPTSIDAMRRIPAVVIRDNASNAEYVMVARSVGARSHRLGVVDSLLKKKDSPALWVDIGSPANGTLTAGKIDAVQKRPLANVFAGMQEMTTAMHEKEQSAKLAMTIPFGDKAKKSISIAGETINFWSLAHNENVWPLYEKLGKKVSVVDGIQKMKDDPAGHENVLNIVRVYSEEAAAIAARSVYVDLVLMLATDPHAQLATRETIELRNAETDAYEQIAPIIRVSLLDVNEVLVFQKGTQKIQYVEVLRHQLSDTVARAQDVAMAQAASGKAGLANLAPKAWEKRDLEKVLGGIIRAESNADIAVFAELPRTTPIASAIPFDVAKNLVAPHGNIVVVTVSGRQIKKVAKLISSNRLTRKHIVYGLDVDAATIGNRPFGDNERFSVALTEDALLDMFGISRLGGLAEEFAVRAPFIEGIYADSNQLFYIGGPKVIPISDTANEIERAVRTMKAGRSFDDVVSSAFYEMPAARALAYIEDAEGKPHHVITFDIAYLDIGISKNVTNQNYRNGMDNFPTSRGGIKPYAHLFMYTKMALNYQAPHLHTSLFTDMKYMHTNLEAKPEKDKTKLGLRFRLPWEQTIFKDSSVVISPLFTSVYETKIAPHAWSKDPSVYKKPRTRRIDSLLGVNIDFTKLGFNVDVGGAMATDFNRFNVRDALDFGPGMNFASKWRLFGPVELSSDFTAVYLFPLPQNQALNKIALGVEGTVWLRLARFYDFSVATMADVLMATLQESPKDFVFSTIFGVTISYGRLFRLLG